MTETKFQKHIRIFMEDNNLEDGDYFNLIYDFNIHSEYNPIQVKKEHGLSSARIGCANLFFTDALKHKVQKVMSESEYIKSNAIIEAELKLKEAQERLENVLKM
jgi:hypothetical protein